MKIDLGPPHAGWLPVSLGGDGWQESLEASGVLGDPLRECLELARFALTSSSGIGRAQLWLEPDSYLLEVIPSEGSVEVRVRWIPDHDGRLEREPGRGRIEYSERCSARELAQTLWAAAKRVRAHVVEGGGWSYPFPDGLLREVFALLHALPSPRGARGTVIEIVPNASPKPAQIRDLAHVAGSSIGEVRRCAESGAPIRVIEVFGDRWEQDRELLVTLYAQLISPRASFHARDAETPARRIPADELRRRLLSWRGIELEQERAGYLERGEIRSPSELASAEPDWTAPLIEEVADGQE